MEKGTRSRNKETFKLFFLISLLTSIISFFIMLKYPEKFITQNSLKLLPFSSFIFNFPKIELFKNFKEIVCIFPLISFIFFYIICRKRSISFGTVAGVRKCLARGAIEGILFGAIATIIYLKNPFFNKLGLLSTCFIPFLLATMDYIKYNNFIAYFPFAFITFFASTLALLINPLIYPVFIILGLFYFSFFIYRFGQDNIG